MRSGVTLRVRGLMLEKLIMRAGQDGAEFSRAVRISDREIELSTTERGAKILLSLADRYSIPAEVVSRRGAALLIHRAKKRATVLIAPFAAALVMLLLLSRIWAVEIAPASGALPDGGRSIREYLAGIGVRPGCSLSAIDESVLSARIASECPGYAFVSVAREGALLKISVVPEDPEPLVYDAESPAHIVASRDGIVEEITVLAGRAAVKPGDLVRAGDILIYGEERVSDEASRPISALGSVKARVWIEGSASSPTTFPARIATGRETSSTRLMLFDFSMELESGEEYYISDTKTRVTPVVGLFLPLMREETVQREITIEERTQDPDVLQHALATAAHLDAASRIPGCEILDSWTYVLTEGETITVGAVIEVMTDIAESRPQSFGG